MMNANPGHPLWLKTLLLVSSIAVMGLLFVLEARASEIPEFDHGELDDISSGTLLLQDQTGLRFHSATLNTTVSMTISGMVARITVEQAFANTGTDWLEGLYVFPLPETAAVNAMSIKIGGRVIKGSVTEKETAEKQYQQARGAGQVASLVKQQRANLFTAKVANIAPGKTIRITLHYVQSVAFQNDKFSLRFPMTITPRYANASVSDAQAISPPQFSSVDQVTPTAVLHATLHMPGAIANLRSSSHELVLMENNNDDSVTIGFQGIQPMDRDLVLNWQPTVQARPTVSTWIESINEQDYLLAMVMPPQFFEDVSSLQRELILVIDTSGSMAGESIRAAKRALHAALNGLTGKDRFNLVEFNNYAHKLFSISVPASADNLDLARRLIDSLHADGGTEMQAALQLALANPVEGYLRQIVFVTDGSVGNEDHLFGLIEKRLRRSRLFTVGIGSAPNSYFMRKAAQAGRGTYTYVSDVAEAGEKISELFLALENPALTDISLDWHGEDADYSPSPVADLYFGEPLVISARLGQATTGFTARGKFGDLLWEQSVQFSATPRVNSGLSTIWARQKIESLQDSQRSTADPEHNRQLITDIALEHELVSNYTSLLAIDSTPVRPLHAHLRKTDIATALPAGYVANLINLPRGAADSDSLMLLAVLSALLALVCYRLEHRKREPGRV